MPIIPLSCPSCGGSLKVDSDKDAAICEFCGKPYIVKDAIVQNYISNVTNIETVNIDTVNIYSQEKKSMGKLNIKYIDFDFEKDLWIMACSIENKEVTDDSLCDGDRIAILNKSDFPIATPLLKFFEIKAADKIIVLGFEELGIDADSFDSAKSIMRINPEESLQEGLRNYWSN